MAMQRQTWSVNALATELGIDRRTVARRLDGATVAERGSRGEPRYRLRDALAAFEPRHHAPAAATVGPLGKRQELALVLPFGIEGPMPTEPAAKLCRLYGWTWPDFAELLSWGLPYTSAGRPDSLRGWRITFAHAARFLGLLAHALDLDVDASFPGELARLRGAAPLCIPGEFTACGSSSPRRRSV